MTLTELRYIVTLAQEQHFGHAAERCHVSQPTLSVGVKKLEDELGIMIFERSKSAVRVTPIGQRIVGQAQKVLEEALRFASWPALAKTSWPPRSRSVLFTPSGLICSRTWCRNCTR